MPPSEYMHIGGSGRARCREIHVSNRTQFRFAVIALFAVAAVSLTAVSARALSQESNGAGENGNSTFAYPDEQVNIFGYGQGAQQFEPSGSGSSASNGAN